MAKTPTHPKSVNEYLRRIGAEVLNFRRAMVKIHKGNYYIERAIVRIGIDGVVTCSVKDLEPTADELKEMATELADVTFPRSTTALNADGLIAKIGKGAEGSLFEFWGRKGKEPSTRPGEDGEGLLMCQQRVMRNGVKAYVPWVMMDDGEWLSMEPDGDLPFWKPRVGRGPGCCIMIHEGAKAAAAAETIARSRMGEPAWDHPWRAELSNYEHWGMIGGALAPHRTNYAELSVMAPTEVVYVCDNDIPGISALQKVSKEWGRSLKGIRFGNKFPESWDMADDMPKAMFFGDRWIGPTIDALLEPATWATELVPQPKGQNGKPGTRASAAFAAEWLHVVTPEVYLHRDWPNRMYDVGQFDNLMAPFSHVAETGRVLKREASSKAICLKYNPAQKAGVYEDGDTGQYVNTYCPPKIAAEKGDPAIWLDYMENLIPGEQDRYETLKWVATLIVRPDVRMHYGLLLVSETQGVGKSTLGDKILTPLVGSLNVSVPSESEIVESNYNYWVAHKRLTIVHEIYAGNSSKAYNKLKSVMTDNTVTVSKKYQPNYVVDNWIHILACSNSLKAMKLTMDDRRWLIPRLAEKRRNDAHWERLNNWLAFGGGLGVIRWWAEQFIAEHGPVNRGENAPWTDSKREMVEEGFSPGQAHVSNKLGMVRSAILAGEIPNDSFVVDTQLVESIKMELHEGRTTEFLEKPRTVRQVAQGDDWLIGAHKSVSGRFARGSRVITLDPITADTTLEALTAAGRHPVNLQKMGVM